MTKDVKPGDKVRWNTSQGETSGTVKKKLTRPTRIKVHLGCSRPCPESSAG